MTTIPTASEAAGADRTRPTTAAVGPCRNCGHRVANIAQQCRFCGYDADPARNERARFVWGVVGLLLTLSVAGAPVGLVLLWKAFQHHRAATGRVVDPPNSPRRFLLWLLTPPGGLLASTPENQQSRSP